MRILSFETATYFGGVGLLADDGTAASAGPFPARASSRETLRAAREMLSRHGWTLDDLDLIAVSTGPGLFTGVRVGLSLGKTMAWTREGEGKPALVGVGTLRAVARMALASAGGEIGESDLVAAVTDARRGEVYAALYEAVVSKSDSEDLARLAPGLALRPVGEEIVVRPENVVERLFENKEAHELKTRPIHLIGDGIAKYEEPVVPEFGPAARVWSYEDGDLALEVARLGLRRLVLSGAQTPDQVEPHYVRRPDARPPATGFLSV